MSKEMKEEAFAFSMLSLQNENKFLKLTDEGKGYQCKAKSRAVTYDRFVSRYEW